MQEFFWELDIASDTEHELLQVAGESILDYCKVRAVLIYMSNDRHVYYCQTGVNRNFLYLLPQGVQLVFNVWFFHPEVLDGPSHQTIDICHKERQACAPDCLKERLWEECRGQLDIRHNFDNIEQQAPNYVILFRSSPLNNTS